MFIFSCQQEDNVSLQNEIQQVTKEVDTSKLIDFKGLPVNHRFSTPTNELEIEHNYEELKKIYNKKRAVFNKGNTTTNSEDLPEAEMLVAEAEEHVKEYPFGEEKADEEKWEMIQNDFPTLTEEQIADNIDLIDEYYSQNLDYETVAGLANKTDTEQIKLKTQLKTANKIDFERLFCVLTKFQNPNHIIVPYITRGRFRTGEFSYILSLRSMYFAHVRAGRYSERAFSGGATDTKKDAYRHVIWSSLLAKYYWTISSKSKRLRFAEAVGHANEACGQNDDDGMYMDFHNNRIGRELFNKNTSYKKKKVWFVRITYGLKLPSNSKLRDLTKSLVNRARFINPDTYSSIPRRVQQIKQTTQSQVVYISNRKK